MSRLPTDCPQIPALAPIGVLSPSVYHTSPLSAGRVPGPLVHSSLVRAEVKNSCTFRHVVMAFHFIMEISLILFHNLVVELFAVFFLSPPWRWQLRYSSNRLSFKWCSSEKNVLVWFSCIAWHSFVFFFLSVWFDLFTVITAYDLVLWGS